MRTKSWIRVLATFSFVILISSIIVTNRALAITIPTNSTTIPTNSTTTSTKNNTTPLLTASDVQSIFKCLENSKDKTRTTMFSDPNCAILWKEIPTDRAKNVINTIATYLKELPLSVTPSSPQNATSELTLSSETIRNSQIDKIANESIAIIDHLDNTPVDMVLLGLLILMDAAFILFLPTPAY